MARVVGGPRLQKAWTQLLGQTTAFTADATSIIAGTFTPGEPGTILRMLGEYIIGPTSAPVAGDGVVVGIGIGIVSADAAAAGSASMPDPGGEPDFPWLYWMRHPFFYAGTSVQNGSGQDTVRKFFDSRSMRKIKPRESLVMVAEYGNLAGTPPLEVTVGGIRVLFGT